MATINNQSLTLSNVGSFGGISNFGNPGDLGDDSLGDSLEVEMPVNIKPAPIDFKAKDMELYQNWKKTGSKNDMSRLLTHLSPLIYREVGRSAGTLPTAALSMEGKIWAAKAIRTFDPDKGYALSTHVSNYLQRVRRLNYKYQHAARLPENMKLDFHKYNTGLQQLGDELNRDPTEEELSSHLGWSKGQVVRFKQRVYSDLLESGSEKPTEVLQYSSDKLLMDHLLAQLTPEERFILDNKGKLSAIELAQKLGVNNNRLNYLQSKLVTKIKNLKLELGL